MKILVIDGHPHKESISNKLSESYAKGARDGGHEVEVLHIRDLKFEPILWGGYRERMELEPDLVRAQELVKWCKHLVVVVPMWWSSPPALFRGFIERIFLPRFAFKYNKNGTWQRLLKGRSARVIYTQGAPKIMSYLSFEKSFWSSLKWGILWFCGFSPVKRTIFARADKASKEKREKWAKKTYELGKKGK